MSDRNVGNRLKRTAAWLVALAVLAFVACIAPLPALAQDGADAAAAASAEVIDMRILNNAERARLIIDLSVNTQFATASLSDPDRIVVDVRAGALAAPVAETEGGTGLIATYELDEAEPGRIRATLKLSAPSQVQQAYMVEPIEGQPARLIVDLVPDTAAHFAANVEADRAAAEARYAAEQAASAPDQATAEAEAGSDEGEAAAPPPVIEAGPKPRPLIVIDPGHGGIDGGAEAASGVQEKDIVLKFARELKRLLVEQDRYDVAMTREDDSFLRLEARVAVARSNKADLMISIHADKFEDPTIRGTSIYVRDELATDELAKVLAENENRADLVAGFAPPEVDERVTSILVELMRRETRRQSFLAAQSMLKQLEDKTRLRKIPLHKADFFVLQAPEVPAVLLELGFLSNDADVANLTQSGWQDATAEAIAAGVAGYFDGMTQN